MRRLAQPIDRILALLACACLAAVPVASAAAPADPLERLESDSRAKPDVVADELEQLLATGSIEGYERLDAQHLLGMLRARLHQPAAAEAVAQSLAKPGAPGYQKVPHEQLTAVAACVRA